MLSKPIINDGQVYAVSTSGDLDINRQNEVQVSFGPVKFQALMILSFDGFDIYLSS